MSLARILLVHPDASILTLMTSMLRNSGHQIDEVTNDPAAVRRLDRGGVDLILAGANPSDPDSLELLSFARRKFPRIPFILLIPENFPSWVQEAKRMGAFAVFKFPMPALDLRAAVLQACERSGGGGDPRVDSLPRTSASPATNGSAPRPLGEGNGWPLTPQRGVNGSTISASASPLGSYGSTGPAPAVDGRGSGFAARLVGEDPVLRRSIELAENIAATRNSVVITGEQGTGKTLLAQAIHERSPRGSKPLLEISCTGVDEFLLERDLFGQKFDGNESYVRSGLLERAHQGTLLIDGISELPLSLQDRLLGVIQEGNYTPMGSGKPVPIDVRFLFTTRESLPVLVEQGKFRRELHDRISDVSLRLPPLRQRDRDVTLLADHFRERYSREYGKTVSEFAADARDLMHRHDWPGNVREMESVIQRGVAMSPGPRINAATLSLGNLSSRVNRPSSFHSRQAHAAGLQLQPLKQALEEPEKQIIIQTLRALNWNRQETARVLDINRTTLYKKMKKYGLLLEEATLLN